MRLEATLLRPGHYAVRPEGCLGTCGWVRGQPWTVRYVKARTEKQALRKARRVTP